MKTKASAITAAGLLALAAQVANAATITITNDIVTSTTWTSNNVYDLGSHQWYVRPGATLTITAGTLVMTTANAGGSLAVSRGGKIYVNGTKDHPVIMTSTLDTMTAWHEGCSEWGNLTIMGRALVSASSYGGVPVPGNTATPTGLNVKQMEGLIDDGINDTYYGGADDNDDSGALHYVSLRYGGKVIGLNNELNGLSMGGIGRGTDVDHIEIMNNKDDGIETWGGTVNYKYLSIWNAGDDSIDIDEGWRGKMQFGLLVEGSSGDFARGSGVSDNCFEMDGAEESDAQPVTTGVIDNFTAIGQPLSGRGGTAWRDNCRMQFHNCIWMNVGLQLVRFDNTDGDGQKGYGYNGTLSWADTWTTPYTAHSLVNAGSWLPGMISDPAVLYQAQTSGNLAEIKDSVFYDNENSAAYTEATARGVLNASNNNVMAVNMPIKDLVRGTPVTRGGLTVLPVNFINPCAANDAVTSVGTAPNDGFFTPAKYRGAFSPNYNWLAGWTASDAYGMTDTSMNTNAPTSAIAFGVVVAFQSENLVNYSVQRAAVVDGPYTEVATISGDGSQKTYVDDVASKAFYRVVVK